MHHRDPGTVQSSKKDSAEQRTDDELNAVVENCRRSIEHTSFTLNTMSQRPVARNRRSTRVHDPNPSRQVTHHLNDRRLSWLLTLMKRCHRGNTIPAAICAFAKRRAERVRARTWYRRRFHVPSEIVSTRGKRTNRTPARLTKTHQPRRSNVNPTRPTSLPIITPRPPCASGSPSPSRIRNGPTTRRVGLEHVGGASSIRGSSRPRRSDDLRARGSDGLTVTISSTWQSITLNGGAARALGQ